jgi:hypothetical protein
MTRPRRPVEELLATDEPAWPRLSAAIQAAQNPVEALPPDGNTLTDLFTLQVTVRSTLGALVHRTGGLLIDHGWVRVLGGHSARLGRSLVAWNAACGASLEVGAPPLLLVADDVLGGHFALNGGQFPGAVGTVFYFAPDTLEWESLERGFTDFITFLLEGDLATFYADRRWPGWQDEVAALPGDNGFSIYPPLWAAEGGPIAERDRRAVPMAELIHLGHDLAEQLNGLV